MDEVSLQDLLNQLCEKESRLLELDEIIEKGIKDLDELEAELISSEEYREKIISGKSRSKIRLEKKSSSRRESNESTQPATTTVRLPKLSIDKFYGEITEWQNFWAQFESSFHLNQGLSKVEKFQYLKSVLGGSAASAISGLTLTEASYDSAIDILKDRFGRKDVVVSAHVNKLLSLSPVKRVSDVLGLRKLYDACDVQIRSLKSAGIEITSYGSLLYPLLVKLIPDDIILDFNRHERGGDDWNVSALLQFLKSEIECRERTFLFKQNGDKDNQSNSTPLQGKQNAAKTKDQSLNSNKESKKSSAAALTASTGVACVFCDQAHDSKDCGVSLEERINALRSKGLCFRCLKGRHAARFCRAKIFCKNCNKRHNRLLCEKQYGKPEEPNKTDTVEPNKADTVVSSVTQGQEQQEGVVFLQTVSALAVGDKGTANVRALMDGGSQRSFIREDLSRKLKLQVEGEEYLTIHAFGTKNPINVKRKRVKLKLQSMYEPGKFLEIRALETPEICSALIQIPDKQIKDTFSELGLQLADCSKSSVQDGRITVLIGADYYWEVMTGALRRISGSLVGLETMFGWVIHGPQSNTTVSIAQNHIGVMKVVVEQGTSEDELVSKSLQQFWNLDSLGITTEQINNDEDVSAMKAFESCLQIKGGRYQVNLPWKDEFQFLPDNLSIAKYRFQGLIKKFKKNPALYLQYKEVIDNYLEEGIVEQVEIDNQCIEGKTYYLPHQAVVRKDKSTTQLRVVFDASSHARGCPSLNDSLTSGPNLNPDLLCLLIKFRMHAVAMTADVEKAYLQISIAPEDRDSLRFLWVNGSVGSSGPIKEQVMRLTRVPFGVTSSPFLLAATIKTHIKKFEDEYPTACKAVEESLYVDDLIAGADSAENAFETSKEIKEILKGAKMNMRKWRTNSKELSDKWEGEAVFSPISESNIKFPQSVSLKVLGIEWRTDSDVFAFDGSALLSFLIDSRNTKRGVLQAAGRIYDPIGFLAPFTIRAKILFQQLWERGISWDEKLPEDLSKQWENWCQDLHLLSSISIPRYYFKAEAKQNMQQLQLHCFCDASEKAYGAVVYLRFQVTTVTAETALVASKARVAPLKRITLPRLELMGGLLGVRLANHIEYLFKDKFKVSCHYWTDSMVALHWIKGSAYQWKQFVQNRVNEIQAKSDPLSWTHVPGSENPADSLTRGQQLQTLRANELWWNGPPWLKTHPTFWPNVTTEKSDRENAEKEKRTIRTVVQSSCISREDKSEPLLHLSKYSSLSKVLRITAWVKRFVFNAQQKSLSKHQGPLTASEIQSAENFWITVVQRNSFLSEIENLKSELPITQKSRIFQFKPFLDENGILRLGGRLQMADFNFEQSHPILLPNKDTFTELLIKCNHERVAHAGVAETLAQLRDKYWILKGRQRVKAVRNKCLLCKRFSAKSFNQGTAPLPVERISESAPFESSGVDFAGPLYVRAKNSAPHKAYIALFTCAVTRAVHLELVTDMSTETFLLAFRRFTGRRGVCKTIFSDNAKTFKRADKDLKEIWNNLQNEKLANHFGKKGITWKFIVEKACWWGGFYERMVRAVKTCLKKMLGKAYLNFEELQTILIEVEAIVNSRPLTFTYSDAGEPSPLTPGHFLIGRRITSLPSSTPQTTAPTSKRDELTKRYQHRQSLLNNFWKRWKQSYIMDLRSAHQIRDQQSTTVKEGAVVLICDDKEPRQMWRMGIIDKTHVGRDGKVRACDVRLANKTTIRRPVQLLCPLELNS